MSKILRASQKSLLTLAGVFLLCVALGVIAGTYIKHQLGTANAASENITVANNNQISTIDQGTPAITRTSTVTVLDAAVTAGYTLSARVENNSIPSSVVTIYSTTSTTCTESSPCTLTSDPIPILETTTTEAAQPAGHTTDWTLTITLPGATAAGNYLLDIAYSEQANIPPPDITTVTYMQEVTTDLCADTPNGSRTTLIDRRNNQTYYIQKIANTGENGVGDLCWMASNLRYAGGGTNTYGDTKTLYAGSSTSFTTPYYYNPGGSTDYTNTSPGTYQQPSTYGFYGYLYNWCAAMGGQAAACNNTSASGFNTAISICPAGWRLPTGVPTTGEFTALYDAINGGHNNNTGTDQGLRDNFLTVYSGAYDGSLGLQGYYGWLWSSWAYSGTNADHPGYMATFSASGGSDSKSYGFAVRCVKS